MSKPKVYLAKSNRANPELVNRVRQTLLNFDVEVVEFNGGKFSHAQMNNCEQLVVVPDLTNDIYDDNVIIGKGLYGQITEFINRKGEECIFIITDNKMTVSEIEDISIIDYDDYICHARVDFNLGGNDTLIESFDDIYGPIKGIVPVSVKTSKYYYLLIRKK